MVADGSAYQAVSVPDPRLDLTMLAMVVDGFVSKPLATASRIGD